MKCTHCGCTEFEYTNWYDKKTGKIIYRCVDCNHLYITEETLVDVTLRNDIGKILQGIDMEASIARIEKEYGPLDQAKKRLEKEGI